MKNHRNKIVILIPYFGPFPWYFYFFLHSCKFNPRVSFVVITDNDHPESMVSNVRFVRKTFKEINSIASNKLGFETAIDIPYKLCDFKPAYGFLFPEIIEGYEFWGYSDLDVIFGDIRRFITDTLLKKYDLITVHEDYTTGVFTIFRNCKKMNTLFMKSNDYKKVFSESRSFYFDETNFAFGEFKMGISPDNIRTEVESMTHLVKKMQHQNLLTAYFDSHILEGLPGRLKWQKGRLVYQNKFEVMLFNLILLKKIYNPENIRKIIPDSFYISKSRIYYRGTK